MTNNEPERPERKRPEAARPNIGKRPIVSPILAVVGLVALVVVLYLVISWIRYNT